ncbi:MAG: iron-containing redox enzyme family protein, partial [Proteobacteria bacterium]|nr:iron-containing redox enzyme family protein [Pseudomonadota bacterium]
MSLYPNTLGPIAQDIESLFAVAAIDQHPLFKAAINGSLSVTQRGMASLQILHVVRAFPRFLSAIITNLEDLHARIPLVGNLLEEHGHLDASKAHVKAYEAFLLSNGCTQDLIDASRPAAPVIAYTRAIIDLCLHYPWQQGLAALGVIEDIVARVSPVVNSLSGKAETHFFDAHEQLDVGHA